MVYGSRTKLKQVTDDSVSISNEIIERVTTFKYLGFYLDSELNFDYHISQIYNTAYRKLGALRKTRLCLSSAIALQLYKSLILPQFDYCDVLYSNANQTALQDLQKVQNISCRIILKAGNRTSVRQIHSELKLISL